MDKKLKIKERKVINIRPGERFLAGGFSTHLIMTDVVMKTRTEHKRLAISENGNSFWIDMHSNFAQQNKMVFTELKKKAVEESMKAKKILSSYVKH